MPKFLPLARRSIGLIIVLAAMSKLEVLTNFAASLQRLISMPPWLAFAITILVVCTELGLGIFLVITPRQLEIRLYSAALFASFLVVHVVAIVRKTGPCECFGSGNKWWLLLFMNNHWLMAAFCLVATILLLKDETSSFRDYLHGGPTKK